MDVSRSELRLHEAIEDYLNNEPDAPTLVRQRLEAIGGMLNAPRYSPETPGHRTAREVAEETGITADMIDAAGEATDSPGHREAMEAQYQD